VPPRAVRRDLPMTNAIRRAHAAGTRDSTGLPGRRYWQLWTDYAIEARLDRQQRSNAWIDMALTEGKNREVRKVLAHLDLPVVRLIRVAFGPLYLGELERGAVEEVPAQALAALFGVKAPRKEGWAKPRSRRRH